MSQDAPEFLRPLQKRTRPAPVAAELEALGRLPRGVVLSRVRDKDKAKGPARETLVSLARTFHLRGDRAAVGIVLDVLTARVSGALRRKMAGWRVAKADEEELLRHVLAGLYASWLNTQAGEELWECNFTTPFDVRAITLIGSFFPKTVMVESLSAFSAEAGEDGADKDIADPEAEASFADMLLNLPERAALQALAAHQAAWSHALHDKYRAGYTEEEIASRYGVSSRTIRSWIGEARRFLLAHVAQARAAQEDD